MHSLLERQFAYFHKTACVVDCLEDQQKLGGNELPVMAATGEHVSDCGENNPGQSYVNMKQTTLKQDYNKQRTTRAATKSSEVLLHMKTTTSQSCEKQDNGGPTQGVIPTAADRQQSRFT